MHRINFQSIRISATGTGCVNHLSSTIRCSRRRDTSACCDSMGPKLLINARHFSSFQLIRPPFGSPTWSKKDLQKHYTRWRWNLHMWWKYDSHGQLEKYAALMFLLSAILIISNFTIYNKALISTLRWYFGGDDPNFMAKDEFLAERRIDRIKALRSQEERHASEASSGMDRLSRIIARGSEANTADDTVGEAPQSSREHTTQFNVDGEFSRGNAATDLIAAAASAYGAPRNL